MHSPAESGQAIYSLCNMGTHRPSTLHAQSKHGYLRNTTAVREKIQHMCTWHTTERTTRVLSYSRYLWTMDYVRMFAMICLISGKESLKFQSSIS